MTKRERSWTKRGIKITENEFEYLRLQQKDKCAICGSQPKRLNVDHDHVTGQIRGLLCYHCNRFVVGRHRNGRLLHLAGNYLQRAAQMSPLNPDWRAYWQNRTD